MIAAFILVCALSLVAGGLCPGGKWSCDPSRTCCELPDGEQGCCPYPDAFCCPDHVHCCPSGQVCDKAGGGHCHSPGHPILAMSNAGRLMIASSSDAPIDLSNTSNDSSDTSGDSSDSDFDSNFIPTVSFLMAGDGNMSNDHCKDGTQCPDQSTCCAMAEGSFGCCPMVDAVCCSDLQHCCPMDYKCEGGICHKNKNEFVPYGKMLEPTVVPQFGLCPDGELCPYLNMLEQIAGSLNSTVTCSNGEMCLKDSTCCANADGKMGCCNLLHGVCCDSEELCCPEGYKCLPDGAGCSVPTAELQ